MNVANFKAQTAANLQTEIARWEAGEKQWNVSNQFDESVLESALENLDKMSDDQWEWWANTNAPIMALAHALSAFEVDSLDSAWVD